MAKKKSKPKKNRKVEALLNEVERVARNTSKKEAEGIAYTTKVASRKAAELERTEHECIYLHIKKRTLAFIGFAAYLFAGTGTIIAHIRWIISIRENVPITCIGYVQTIEAYGTVVSIIMGVAFIVGFSFICGWYLKT